jgi:hypothetical protein
MSDLATDLTALATPLTTPETALAAPLKIFPNQNHILVCNILQYHLPPLLLLVLVVLIDL